MNESADWEQRNTGYPSWMVITGLCALLFFLFPTALQSYDQQTLAFFKIGSIISVFVCFGLYRVQRGLERFGAVVLSYLLVMTFTCIKNGGSLDGVAYSYWPIGASVLLALALVPRYKRELLKSLVIVMGAYAILNLIVLCFVPVGTPFWHADQNNTFLSYRNGYSRFYLPAIVASLLLDCEKGKRISLRSAMLFIIGATQSILAYSATSFAALIIFSAALVLISWMKPRHALNLWTYMVAYACAFIAVVVLRLQDCFAFFLGLIGRSTTFTGRSGIWDTAISLIGVDSGMFGLLGISTSPFVDPAGRVVGTAHNAILDIITWGGFIALGLIIFMLILVAVRLYDHWTDLGASILTQYIGAFLFMGLSEAIVCPALFLFLGIAFAWGYGGSPHHAKCKDREMDKELLCVPKSSAFEEAIRKDRPQCHHLEILNG